MKYTIKLLALLMITASVCFACGDDEEDEMINNETEEVIADLIGSWEKVTDDLKETFVFNSDGTGRIDILSDKLDLTIKFTWTLENENELTLSVEDQDGGEDTIEKGVLTFIDNNTIQLEFEGSNPQQYSRK